jgi:hypothetical protein
LLSFSLINNLIFISMKKSLLLFVALFLSAGLFAQQQRVVKVQGIPHELLTRKLAQGKWKMPRFSAVTRGTNASINPRDFDCWIGSPNESLQVDTAYLVVKFTDGKRTAGDSILAWGYRFNPKDAYGDSVLVHTIDMIRAVANSDQRFTVLSQYTGVYGFTVGGFGFNYSDGECARVPLAFNYNGAKADPSIAFHYEGSPNCAAGQVATPISPVSKAADAIATAANAGVIDHPFNAFYGYPAYDYDYWVLTSASNPKYEWQAGWYNNGFWSFYTKNQLSGSFVSSLLGISTRRLYNHFVDGLVFAKAPSWSANIDGSYLAVDCNCAPCSTLLKRKK